MERRPRYREQLGAFPLRLVGQCHPQLLAGVGQGAEQVNLRDCEVGEVVDEDGADRLERSPQATREQVARPPQPLLGVEQVVGGEALLVAGVGAGTLAVLRPHGATARALVGRRGLRAAVGGAGEVGGGDFLPLQLLDQGRDALDEPARVRHPPEVIELLPVVQLGDDLVEEEAALHARQRAGRRVVGGDDVVGEVLKGADEDTQTTTSVGPGTAEQAEDLFGPAQRRRQPEGGPRAVRRRAAAVQQPYRLARASGTTEDRDACRHVLFVSHVLVDAHFRACYCAR